MTTSKLLQAIATSTLASQHALQTRGRAFGLQRAVVTNNGVGRSNPDPQQRRRIKVQIPSKGITETGWLECLNIQPYADPPLPRIGTTVFVIFIDGNPHDGVWFGNSTNRRNPPAEQTDPENDNTVTIPGDEMRAVMRNQYDLTQGDREVETEGNLDSLTEGEEFRRTEQDFEMSCGRSQNISNDSGCEIHHDRTGFLYHKDLQGAGLYVSQGAMMLRDRYGNQITLGAVGAAISAIGELIGSPANASGGAFNTDFVIDLKGHTLEIVNAGSVSINGTDVTTMPHTHPDTGSANSRGY